MVDYGGAIAREDGAVTAPSRPLRLLMLAPEPFFEPRGTPFSEYHRIKALVELGHHVDLVTYPIGRDVTLPNLRIFRGPRPPFVRRVPIGPSAVKVVLDTLMLFTVARRALAGGYDAVHSHEEMGLVGVWLARLAGRPASLRHALEPAAAARQLQVQRLAPAARASSTRSSVGW